VLFIFCTIQNNKYSKRRPHCKWYSPAESMNLPPHERDLAELYKRFAISGPLPPSSRTARYLLANSSRVRSVCSSYKINPVITPVVWWKDYTTSEFPLLIILMQIFIVCILYLEYITRRHSCIHDDCTSIQHSMLREWACFCGSLNISVSSVG
jgi:hypothetical protein